MKKYESIINRNETDCARIVTLQNALYKEEREHNRLIDEYGQLQDDYMKAQEDITKLKNENENLKQSNQHLSEQSGTVNFKCNDIKGKDPFDNALLKFNSIMLKKEIADLKDKHQMKLNTISKLGCNREDKIQELILKEKQHKYRIKQLVKDNNETYNELILLQKDYDVLLSDNNKKENILTNIKRLIDSL